MEACAFFSPVSPGNGGVDTIVVRRVVAATIAGNRSNSLLWIGELVNDCVLSRSPAIKKMKNNVKSGRQGAIKGV